MRMKIVDGSDKKAIERLLARADVDDPAFNRRVRRIVNDVRTGGDRALAGFAKRFDRVTGSIEVTTAEMRKGAARVEPAVRRAIADAAANIATVAMRVAACVIARRTAGSTRLAWSRISSEVTSIEPDT